jgi:hypothetical protein
LGCSEADIPDSSHTTPNVILLLLGKERNPTEERQGIKDNERQIRSLAILVENNFKLYRAFGAAQSVYTNYNDPKRPGGQIEAHYKYEIRGKIAIAN